MNRTNPRRRKVPETERLPRAAEGPRVGHVKPCSKNASFHRNPTGSSTGDRSPLQERPKSALSGSKTVEHLTNLNTAQRTTDLRETRASNPHEEGGFRGKISGAWAMGNDGFFTTRSSVPAAGSPQRSTRL
jgi:hypothetical protein